MYIAGLFVALVGLTTATKDTDDLAFRPWFPSELGRRQLQQHPNGNQGAAKTPPAVSVPAQTGNPKQQLQSNRLPNPNELQNPDKDQISDVGQNQENDQINSSQVSENSQIQNKGKTRGNGQEQNSLTLSANSLQRTPNGLQGAEDGTAKALVSTNNFINFCSGKPLCKGEQNEAGKSCCNPIVMGDIPAPDKMPTVVITKPGLCETISARKGLTVTAVYRNINLGTFTNPDTTYNGNPQQLDNNGVMRGHTHFTCHLMENAELNGGSPIEVQKFLQDREQAKSQNNRAPKKACFKGFNGQGEEIGGGRIRVEQDLECENLAPGCWTCSTMTGASTHQAAVMGNADRPAQDASTFFSVSNNPNADLCGCTGARNGGNKGNQGKG